MIIEEHENSKDRMEDIINKRIDEGTPVRYPLTGFLLHALVLQHGVGGQLDEDLKDNPGGPAKLVVRQKSLHDIIFSFIFLIEKFQYQYSQ